MEVGLRPVRESDLKAIYGWRNDPTVRKNSFSAGRITMEEHLRYWKGRMEDAGKHSFVIVEDGKDAGLLRLDPFEDGYEVHILVAPAMQGRGVGLAAVAKAKEEAKRLGMKKLIARVKEGNAASQAVFAKNGFLGGPGKYVCKI